MRRGVGAAVVALGLLAGCRKSAPPVPRQSAPRPAIRSLYALDPATLGAVSGVVKFAGVVPPPARLDTGKDPECGATFSQELAVHDGRLANVYVYVKSGPAAAMAIGESWMAPVVLNQKGCSFVPHVVAVMAGQRIEFRDDDSATCALQARPATPGNAEVDLTVGPRDAAGQVRMFRKPEVMVPVRCKQRPWMNAFLNISPTPFFAVTGADGSFELSGLPAGEYVLGLVQEKMGERTLRVTVRAQSTTAVDMTYSL